MKKLKYLIGIIAFTLIGIYSCEERENFDEDLPSVLNVIESISIGSTQGSIDNLSGLISFVLPSGTDITAVELIIDAPNGVEVVSASGSVVDLSSEIQIQATVGGDTRFYSVSARVLPNQVAFINEAATIDEIADDDVIEAARWTRDTYGDDFIYIPYSEVTIEALESVNVVFYFYDQVGTSDLPEEILDKKNVFTQYVVEGGKMLLGGMATGYAEAIGRDRSGLLTIKGNGDGFINDDVWGIDGGVNFQNDQRNHPIYTFTQEITADANGFFPVISGGFKEDHNNLWDAASLLNPGHELGQFAEFENLYGGKVLAVWSGVSDECCPGIVEFLPNSTYTGTIIAIGIGGMEWNMNDGRENLYASNIRGIYRNAIDYLKTR